MATNLGILQHWTLLWSGATKPTRAITKSLTCSERRLTAVRSQHLIWQHLMPGMGIAGQEGQSNWIAVYSAPQYHCNCCSLLYLIRPSGQSVVGGATDKAIPLHLRYVCLHFNWTRVLFYVWPTRASPAAILTPAFYVGEVRWCSSTMGRWGLLHGRAAEVALQYNGDNECRAKHYFMVIYFKKAHSQQQPEQKPPRRCRSTVQAWATTETAAAAKYIIEGNVGRRRGQRC